MAAVRAVDQEVPYALDAPADAGCTLDDDVEDLLLLEDAADLDALQQRGLRAAHRTRGDAEGLCAVEVHLDLDDGLHERGIDDGVHDTVDIRHQLLDPVSLVAEDLLVLAEQPDDEWVLDTGQDVEVPAR